MNWNKWPYELVQTLTEAGIETPADLVGKTVQELREIDGIGLVRAQQIFGLLTGPGSDVMIVYDVDNPNYVEHGSAEHAALLGLLRCNDDDPDGFDGWKLADATAWGAAARPDFLLAVLRQRVNELKTIPPSPQSLNRKDPHYAVEMWVPPEDRPPNY